MSNLEYWNKVSTPPPEVLKTIKAGRLKGMTDIKPQWRYQIMTEVYGPCGIGWKFAVTNKWREDGANGVVFAFADIDLFVKIDGEWSDAIPGHGGSTLVAKESSGLHSSDEGFKMAITDALSTAMKMIGVASSVYLGGWTGSKYTQTAEDQAKNLSERFIKKMKELKKDYPQQYKEVMDTWKDDGKDLDPAKITNLQTQKDIVNDITSRIGKAA